MDEPRKGLVIARDSGGRASTGDVLVYVEADCRALRDWRAKGASRRSAAGGSRWDHRKEVADVVGRGGGC